MNTTKIAIAGVLFLVTLLSGVWLSHRGKPLNTVVFTVHKLIAVGTVILLGMEIYRLHQTASIRGPGLFTVILSGLLVLSLFISGALLSTGTLASPALLIIHRVAPLLATASTFASFYLVRVRVVL